MISVYLPHCGYPQEDFDTSMEQIKVTIGTARRQQRKCILGGDFNSQIGVGVRGDALLELQSSFGLKLLNAVDDPWEKQWTFISTLSVKRKIDFLFASSAFGPNSAEAVSSINLGSDHRAVRTEILIGKCKKITVGKSQQVKVGIQK